MYKLDINDENDNIDAYDVMRALNDDETESDDDAAALDEPSAEEFRRVMNEYLGNERRIHKLEKKEAAADVQAVKSKTVELAQQQMRAPTVERVEAVDEIIEEEEEQWDVETFKSTFTNTEVKKG